MFASSTVPGPDASATPILEYVTIHDAADEVDTRAWQVRQLVEAGLIRAARYEGLTLVSIDDVHAHAEKLHAAGPASDESLTALELPLRIINEARGTEHTVDSLAEACDVDLDEVSNGDVTRMADYIGSVLMAA